MTTLHDQKTKPATEAMGAVMTHIGLIMQRFQRTLEAEGIDLHNLEVRCRRGDAASQGLHDELDRRVRAACAEVFEADSLDAAARIVWGQTREAEFKRRLAGCEAPHVAPLPR